MHERTRGRNTNKRVNNALDQMKNSRRADPTLFNSKNDLDCQSIAITALHPFTSTTTTIIHTATATKASTIDAILNYPTSHVHRLIPPKKSNQSINVIASMLRKSKLKTPHHRGIACRPKPLPDKRSHQDVVNKLKIQKKNRVQNLQVE